MENFQNLAESARSVGSGSHWISRVRCADCQIPSPRKGPTRRGYVLTAGSKQRCPRRSWPAALHCLGQEQNCRRFRPDSAQPNFARFRVNVLECLFFFFLLFYFSSVCVMGLAVAAPTVYHCGEAPRGRRARERTGGDLKEPVPQNLDTHTHVHIHGRSDRSWSSSHTHVCILSSGHFKLFAKSNPGYSCFPY